jgi:hypothetical protein
MQVVLIFIDRVVKLDGPLSRRLRQLNTLTSEECRLGAVWLQPPDHADSSLADFFIPNMEAIRSSETSVYTISTRHHIPEHGILHSHRRENLKSYTLTSIGKGTEPLASRIAFFSKSDDALYCVYLIHTRNLLLRLFPCGW